MAVASDKNDCQRHFVNCRWPHKIFKRCRCCDQKYRFWQKFLKCENCGFKSHAECVRKIERAPASRCRLTNSNRRWTSIGLKMTVKSRTKRSTKSGATDFMKSPRVLREDKVVGRLSFRPEFVAITKQQRHGNNPKAFVSGRKPYRCGKWPTRNGHALHFKTNVPSPGHRAPSRWTFERRILTNNVCIFISPGFDGTRTRGPDTCSQPERNSRFVSTEAFVRAATEEQSGLFVFAPLISSMDDVLHDLLDRANERRPHLALPGFERTSKECVETAISTVNFDRVTPEIPECAFEHVKINELERRNYTFTREYSVRVPCCWRYGQTEWP